MRRFTKEAVVLFTAICLTGCGSNAVQPSQKIDTPVTSTITDATLDTTDVTLETIVEEVSSVEEIKVELPEEPVIDFFAKEGEYSDGFNNYKYNYQIPWFNFETDNAKALNEKMIAFFKKRVDEELHNMEVKSSLICTSVKYKYYICEPYISIIITSHTEFDGLYNDAYTYNYVTDSEVTNEELIAYYGYTPDEFIAVALEKAAEKFDQENPSIPDFCNRDELLAFSTEATTLDIPMYIDENGQLSAYVPVSTIIGDYEDRLFIFDNLNK